MPLLATALYALSLSLLAALHGLRRDVSLVSGAVSDFGIGRTAGLFRLYLGVGSVAALVLSALFLTATAPVFPRRVGIYLAAMALTRIGVGLFPTDGPGKPRTRIGGLHLIFAVATFVLTYMAIAAATPVLTTARGPEVLRPVWSALRLETAVALGAVVATMLPRFNRAFGLAERAFIFGTGLWLLLASVWFALG